MATLRRRDSAAAKLKDSMRQLRRYLDADNCNERLLTQKLDKVDLDREELIAKHHEYVEKTDDINLDDPEQTDFLTPKIDNAIDIVDEAINKIEELLSTSQTSIESTQQEAATERKRLETASAKLQAASCKRLLEVVIKEIEDTIATENPTNEHAIKVESALIELKTKEEEINKSWNELQLKLSEDVLIEEMITANEEVRSQISACRRNAKTFASKMSKSSSRSSTSGTGSSSSMHKLPRIKPPKFSGDIRDFARFKGDFKKIVEKEYDDDPVYTVYVMKESCLEGEALGLVKNLESLDEIWKRFEEKYGNTNDIVDSVLNDLRNVRIPPKFNQDQAVVKLIDTLEKGVQDLTSIGKRAEIANGYTVTLVTKKLPRRIYTNWLDEVEELEGDADRFDPLLKFLKKERKKIEKIIQQSKEREQDRDMSRDKDKDKDDKEKDKRKKNPVNYGKQGGSKMECLIHQKGSHHTRKCRDFLSKTAEERGQLVKDLEACKLCLSLSHVGQSCPRESSWNPCDVDSCGEMHSRLLHGAPALLSMHIRQLQVSTSSEKRDVTKNTNEKRTLLLMQDIRSGKGMAFTFFDNGSGISLVSKLYARKNKLKGVKVSYDLVTVNNVITPQHTMLYDVEITDRNGNVNTITAYEIDEICEETAFFDSNVTSFFKDVKPDDVKRPRRKVDLLVGMNYIKLHPKLSKTNGDLALFNSLFGTGKVLGGQHASIQGSDKTNAFAKMVAYGGMRNIRVERPDKYIDFFAAENLGVSPPPRCNRCLNCAECRFEISQLSKIEQKELEVIRNNLELDPYLERWITKYPYLVDPSILKDNRKQALSIFLRLEKRLSKNEDASLSFCLQFQDFIDRGIFRLLTQEEMDNYDGPVFYISIHEVIKECSASTPVRIVSNASLKYEGISLNDILMKGPNTLSNLYYVLLKFRTYPVALVGDISKMYHSVHTTEKERHLRRVIWRDMKLDEEPKTYGTETVAFGDRPSAAITTVAIRETAELYKHIDETAAQKIKEDMYVDDIATGASTTAEVEVLKKNITAILGKGGFRIKGFVMSGDTSEESLGLLGSGDVSRVLGICYDPERDEFYVIIRINLTKKYKGARKGPDLQRDEIPSIVTMKFTRSILLSITNSIYDLFGFFVPLIIQLKIILRETYKVELNLQWDDDIPLELKEKVVHVLTMLKDAEQLRFKRCITRTDSVGNPLLIIFNDGSQVAMCVVAYIRWKLESGEYSTQFISAKARVTPLERMTVPRSEMQSALLGVRLSKSIQEGCGYTFEDVVHIADSQCTIATIAKESTALKEFMGNRVSEITATAPPSKWFHVKSADNISDLGTRDDATVEDIESGSDWQEGPSWLRMDREQWPVTQDIGPEHIPEEELIKLKFCALVTTIASVLDLQLWRMRTYTLLMQATARVYTALSNKSFLNSEVTPTSLEKAENYWIKQSMVYTSEALEKGHLKSLCPKTDENGIIVLSSRAQEGLKLNYKQDRFPILTSADPLAFLWMKHVHDESHSGRTKTVAKSRRKFWIVRAGRLYEKVRSMCYRCRILDKELAMQQMAALPENRLAIAPIFNTTSIDLFGPLLIKDTVKKRVTMKVWGFIATCAATRAIHIDLTDSYSTDSILQTIRKFITLRGCPTEFISDQGSQMKSAAKDLTKEWDWSIVSNWVNSNKIKWTIVPAEGQHQNGLSESLVKSVKRSIELVIGENILTFSELQLAFFEITNIINSRPLGIAPGSDSDDPTPITPNDLMLGRSSNEVPQGPFNTNVTRTKRFLYVQSIVDDWWQKWYNLVLPSLVPCYKWQQRHRNVKLGDVCLIRYRKSIRSTYRLGRVSDVKTGKDGLVRSVRLQYKLPSEKVYRYVDRAIHGIVVIVPFEEQ